MESESIRSASSWPQAPFEAHVELLELFLERRDEIVERIQLLLNAQRKSAQYQQDRLLLSRLLEDCFFTVPGVTADQNRLRRQLDEAHWASGFRPRESPGLHNDLVDGAEMMVRAFGLWQQTHWPGYNGRLRYAQTLFNLYLIRRLTLLIMRVWDAGFADKRLAGVQGALDHLWKGAPAGQPVFVRDARWLIPVAQSPTTDELAGYFKVAENVAVTLSEEDRREVQKSSIRMAGGHLRSQLRHLSIQHGVGIDDHGLVLTTRRSNALDIALLIQGLAPLLEAYEQAIREGNVRKRIELADVVCQGISPDPELFVNRLDLLGPYSMIEYLFVETNAAGLATHTHMGKRHVQLLEEYKSRMARLAKPLYEDCREFRPVDGAYSPYGVLFGFSSNLIEHMAFKTLQPDAAAHFSLEDIFTSGAADKLAWVSGWRKLPHISREVAKLFEYPQQFAEDVFARIERALHDRASHGDAGSGDVQAGRLLVLPEKDLPAASETAAVPDLPAEYIQSSDREFVAANKVEFCNQATLLHSRLEGEFALSYQTAGGWVALTKDIFTAVLGEGREVKIAGLPRSAAGVLKMMCPDRVRLSGEYEE